MRQIVILTLGALLAACAGAPVREETMREGAQVPGPTGTPAPGSERRAPTPVAEAPLPEAVVAALAAARAAVEQGQPGAAEKVAAARAAAGEPPAAAARDDLLVLEARLALATGQLDAAEQKVGVVLLELPGSSADAEARAVLGMVHAARGRPADALAPLEAALPRLAEGSALRREAVAALVEAHCGVQQFAEAVKLLAEQRDGAADAAARAEVEARALEIIDKRLSFTDVRGLYESMDRTRWPAPLVIYKLARVHAHVRDYGRSRELAQELLVAFPDSAVSEGARKLLAWFEERFAVKRHVIGVLLPLSGEFKLYGENVLQGVKLALQPAEGQAAPAVELVVIDTAGDADKAAAGVEKLVLEHKAIAIVGPMLSNTAQAAAYKAEEYGVPLIALSRREGLTALGQYVFRNCLTNSRQAEAVVRFAMEELGIKRFGILYPNHPYGVELSNFFWDEVEKRRGEVLAVEGYESNATDFDAVVRKLVGRYHLDARPEYRDARYKCDKEETSPYRKKRCVEEAEKNLRPVINFEAIFIPDYHDKVRLLAPAIAFRDVELIDCTANDRKVKRSFDGKTVDGVCLLGGNGWNHPALAERGEKWVQGSVFVDGFYREAGIDSVRQFVERFKATYNREPKILEAQAHDAVAILRDLVTGATPPQDREQMAAALLQVREFPGGAGIVSMGTDGDARHELYTLTIKEGQILPARREIPADGETAKN